MERLSSKDQFLSQVTNHTKKVEESKALRAIEKHNEAVLLGEKTFHWSKYQPTSNNSECLNAF